MYPSYLSWVREYVWREHEEEEREKFRDIEYDSQHGKSCSTTSNTFAQEFHLWSSKGNSSVHESIAFTKGVL